MVINVTQLLKNTALSIKGEKYTFDLVIKIVGKRRR